MKPGCSRARKFLPLSTVTFLVICSLAGAGRAAEQAPAPAPTSVSTGQAGWTTAWRTPNSQGLQSLEWRTNQATGRVYAHTNTITQLGTGMHFTNSQGVLEQTREEILLFPDASGASATNGPCKLFLPADIAQGVIEIHGPDGQVQRSKPLGIAFTQGTNSLFVAGLTNSIGNLLPTGNQVLYPAAVNAAGFRCDLLVTYRARGIECDLIIRSAPSSPPSNAGFTFDPDHCSMQLLTEFFDTSPPQASNERLDTETGLVSSDLVFGALAMRPGKAFTIPARSSPSPSLEERAGERRPISVSRSWQVIDNRSFIIESAPWKALAPQLSKLTASLTPGSTPATRTASAIPKSSQTPKPLNPQTAANNSQTPKLPNSQTASTQQSTNPPIHPPSIHLPPPLPLQKTASKMQLASTELARAPGLTWDYEEVHGAVASFTFTNTTFLITNTFIVGSAEFCGGAVIKMNSGGVIDITNSVKCSTGPYRMCLLTSLNDNSEGDTISGSTGSPYLGDVSTFLSITPASVELSYLRFSHALTAINASPSTTSSSLDLWHCQFADSDVAVLGSGLGNLSLHNVLIQESYDDVPIYLYGGNLAAENVTSDGYADIAYLQYPSTQSVFLTNCMVVNGTSVSIDGASSGFTVNHPFQTAVGGQYYLADQSPYRSGGKTGISSRLAADLRNKTTAPPIVLMPGNSPPTGFNFLPHAQRNGPRVPIGFCYDPIDYIAACQVSTNSLPVTAMPGTVIALFGTNSGSPWGLGLGGGAGFQFQGTAENPVWVTAWTTVQESPGSCSQPGYGLLADGFTGGSSASSFRFTCWSSPAKNLYNLPHGPPSLSLQDCQFYGGQISLPEVPSGTVRNCLFERVVCDMTFDTATFRNNLFYEGSLSMTQVGGDCKDNFFCRPSLPDSFFDSTSVSNNAYVTNYDQLSVTDAGDVVISDTDFQTDPFGRNYFYRTLGGKLSRLINAGSMSASSASLYHFTTQTNQAPETNTTVDIGWHQISLTTSGLPRDQDGDTLFDYAEDANGDGSTSGDPTAFDTYNSPHSLVSGSALIVFTVLK